MNPAKELPPSHLRFGSRFWIWRSASYATRSGTYPAIINAISFFPYRFLLYEARYILPVFMARSARPVNMACERCVHTLHTTHDYGPWSWVMCTRAVLKKSIVVLCFLSRQPVDMGGVYIAAMSTGNVRIRPTNEKISTIFRCSHRCLYNKRRVCPSTWNISRYFAAFALRHRMLGVQIIFDA